MWTRLTLSLVLMAPLPVAAGSPIAELICVPRAEMVRRLILQYGARLAGQGVRDVDAAREVWSDPRGGWALVQSYADGQACILAMGDGWEAMPGPDPA